MEIPISKEFIFSVAIGNQIDILTTEGSSVAIEAPLTVLPANLQVEPGAALSVGARALLEILHSTIVEASVEDSVLTLSFSNGFSLVVPHSPGFEAWNINMPRREPSLIVMGPAGEMMTVD